MSANPIFGEILASDLLYGFTNVADLNLVGLASLDPSVLWAQIKINPWLAMLVYEDMEEKDDVVSSSLDTRKDGVLAKSRQVLPASDMLRDRKVAEFVQDTLDGYFIRSGERYSGLNQILFEILDAIGQGVAIGEIVFGQGSDRITIEDVKFKPQSLFTFGEGVLANSSLTGPQTGPLRLRSPMGVKGVGADGVLPQDKFLVASYKPKKGNRWGSPLCKKVFWPSWFKRAGTKVWLKYLEKGPGTTLARYPDGASQGEKQVALDAARAINEESAAAVPNKFQIEVMEHVRQSMGDSFEAFTDDFANNAIMRVILGQTLTGRGGEGGGGWSKGDVHQQVRDEKIEGDAKFLMHVVNTFLVPPIVLFNFGPSTPRPLWVIKYEPKRDQSADSIVDARLAGLGLEIPKKYVYEKYQIPEPAGDEEVLEPPTAPPGSPATGVDSSADFAERLTEMVDLLDRIKVTGDQRVAILGDVMESWIKSADFAEKKTSSDDPLRNRSGSKIGRFKKLHPSTTRSSGE
jgi:phage gp29-like protein